MVSRINECGNKSVAVESCREHSKEEENAKREGRKMNETGGGGEIGNKESSSLLLYRCRLCIPVRLLTRPDAKTHCFIALYYKIYYGFTAALLRREHRRSYCSVVPQNTFTKRSTTSLKFHVILIRLQFPVSGKTLGCLKSHVWVWGSPLPGVLWSFPVLKYSKKKKKKINTLENETTWKSDEYFGWSLSWGVR